MEMDEDNCEKGRMALADVTNKSGKRAFSVFSGGVDEGLVGIKDKGKRILGDENDGVKRACILPRSLKENASFGILKDVGRFKERNFAQVEVQDALGSNRKCEVILGLTKNDVFPRENDQIQDGEKMREISTSMILKGASDNEEMVVEVSLGGDDTGTSGEAGEYCEILEDDCAANTEFGDETKNLDTGYGVGVSMENAHGETDILQDEGDHIVVDDFVQSQTGSVDHNRLPLSQESRCFGLERCTNLKGGNWSNISASIETLKTCTCSFCTKAAYIWTDLHYQDFKGRVATVKKSEKEASLLAAKQGNTPQISSGVSVLESKLMGQWRSLFSQMEKIYEHEGNQLEASLLSLKDLREKCKVDLEFLNAPGS